MTAAEKLRIKINQQKHITVGLDTDIKKIPQHLLNEKDPILKFNEIIIENTFEFAASYKINFAFYEKEGLKGFESLKKTIELIPEDAFIIGDAKRGDIGNTSEMYAISAFEHFNCDAVTLHPYMGLDSLEPFINFKDKISFVLALTSNKGASDFEKLKLENGKYLFQEVIDTVNKWNENKNLGIVFGATNTLELEENIDRFDDLPVLLPGVGAQGGSLEDVVKTFNKNKKENYLINVSRSLIYINDGINFGNFVKNEIKNLNDRVRISLGE